MGSHHIWKSQPPSSPYVTPPSSPYVTGHILGCSRPVCQWHLMSLACPDRAAIRLLPLVFRIPCSQDLGPPGLTASPLDGADQSDTPLAPLVTSFNGTSVMTPSSYTITQLCDRCTLCHVLQNDGHENIYFFFQIQEVQPSLDASCTVQQSVLASELDFRSLDAVRRKTQTRLINRNMQILLLY